MNRVLDSSVGFKWVVPEVNSDKALYVAVAEQEGCDLVTADSRLISNLQNHFPFIVDQATLPQLFLRCGMLS